MASPLTHITTDEHVALRGAIFCLRRLLDADQDIGAYTFGILSGMFDKDDLAALQGLANRLEGREEQVLEDYRLWVNSDRTVLVRLWNSGQREVCIREDSRDMWGPPIRMEEEK